MLAVCLYSSESNIDSFPQRRREILRVGCSLFLLKSLSPFFFSPLKLGRSSMSAPGRASLRLSNGISDMLSSICIRNWRGSTFPYQKGRAAHNRHSNFYRGVMLTSNKFFSRYFVYADHENTIGIKKVHEFSKLREKLVFRPFFMDFWVVLVNGNFLSDNMILVRCRYGMKSDQNFKLYKINTASFSSENNTVRVVQTPWNYPLSVRYESYKNRSKSANFADRVLSTTAISPPKDNIFSNGLRRCSSNTCLYTIYIQWIESEDSD